MKKPLEIRMTAGNWFNDNSTPLIRYIINGWINDNKGSETQNITSPKGYAENTRIVRLEQLNELMRG